MNRRRVLPLVLLAATALCLVAPTLRYASRWAELYDWRYFEAMEEVFRLTVVKYGQVPLWNPYACGGEVALANPQSTVAAPTFLLSVLFGTSLGMRLSLLFYLGCALHGAYVLARRLGASTAASLVAGLSYGTCGWFALHLSTGHLNFAGAALYPYLLVCWQKAAHVEPAGATARDALDRGAGWFWVIPGGALLAWMAGLGGTYTVPMAIVLLGSYAAAEAVMRRSLRPVWIGLGIGVAALLLGAARLFPLLEFVRDHPRHVAEHDANTPFEVLRMFLAWRDKLGPVAGHVYWWHEYCAHLPYLAFALGCLGGVAHKLGAATGSRVPGETKGVRLRTLGRDPIARRALLLDLVPAAVFAAWTILAVALPSLDRHLAHFGVRLGAHTFFAPYRDLYHLTGLLAFWRLVRGGPAAAFAPVIVLGLGIVVGTEWPHGPWWLLRRLPVYHDLRVPSRYLVLVALSLSVWAALGLDALLSRLGSPRARRVAGALAVGLVLADGLAFSVPAYRSEPFEVMHASPEKTPPFYQVRSDWREMLWVILDRHGIIHCDEEAPLPPWSERESLDVGPVPQVRLVDPSAGTVTQLAWSPNLLRYRVDARRAAVVQVNESWNEHWEVASGRAAILSEAGRLAFSVPPGTQEVTLRYLPRSFVAGAIVSLVSIPALAVLFLVLLRRRMRSVARPHSRSVASAGG